MKILRLLSKKNLTIIFFLFFGLVSYAEESTVDIWNIDKKKTENNSSNLESSNVDIKETETTDENSIYKMQKKKNNFLISLDNDLGSKEIKIFGLYDPEDYDLDIEMWSNSNGDQIKNIFSKLDKIKLSDDANELMKISLLTNSYAPKNNITEKDFLDLKANWLIKNSDLELIEEYLIKNQIFDIQPNLSRHLVDQYLSEGKIEKSCEIFSKNLQPLNDEYLSRFNIYCLIYRDKKDEAQLILDLKYELGFKDKYFEKKINYLFGYNTKVDKTISEKSILDFHLAHVTNPDFSFEPKDKTNKMIWKYLSSSNLLKSFEKIEISEIDKISTLEKAAHNKNYPEKSLFEIYKQFQFNINQLLNADQSYKTLTEIEQRALIYQKILLESETVAKLKLLKLLKNLFKKDNISNAFDEELKKFLEKINPTDIPDNLTSFYYTNIEIKKDDEFETKFNKDILHQSILLNYFNGDYSKSKIEKDVENFLKKIKKNKGYFFSKKDQIFLETLKYDGIEISKKYDDLYEVIESEVPSDIQVMINNNEKGVALLRIVEVIGQDKLERIDEDTIYFIISTLNQLDIDLIRNKILLKVLPLKV
tara:strand:- start:645 stop:2417 length:1773 start_codon:yes stop_codon:yes gene_type:complete